MKSVTPTSKFKQRRPSKFPNYRCPIPTAAKSRRHPRRPDGSLQVDYYLNGKQIGTRFFDDEGELYLEHGVKNGEKHGREYWFNSWNDGRPTEMTPYRHGKMHGTAMQFTDNGEILITYQMKNGVGLDLWCDNLTHTLSEEQYQPQPGELGYRRNWNEDEKTIYEEYYFLAPYGYHGIWREWNDAGRLRRGFPHYYVHGKKVGKREYLKACLQDKLLPAYRKSDDRPKRSLPREYIQQRGKKPKRRVIGDRSPPTHIG